MKDSIKSSRKLALGVALAGTVLGTTTAIATTDADIQAAIDHGLAYLSSTQTAGGYWNYGSYDQAATGAAAYAMLTQYSHWGDVDLGNVATYQTQVTNAINYLLSNAATSTVSTRNDGVNICPGGSGNCTGVYWSGSGEGTYTTGLVAPALVEYANRFGGGANAVATTTGPLAGLTWGQIAQANNNEWAAGQNTIGVYNGGWRYFPGPDNDNSSDMSTTQWAIISFIYNQTLSAAVPDAIKTNLATWLANVQAANGSACYQPNTGPCDNSDTGGLLLGLSFLGKNTSDPAVQAALNWLNDNWDTTANGRWYGNFGHPYAMWSDYKGLQVTIGLDDNTWITNLLNTTCSGSGYGPPTSGICNWWQDYNQWLVANQAGNGSFPGYQDWANPLATALVLPILGGTVIPTPPVTTPEPGTLALMLAGLAGAGTVARRHVRKC